jgi:aromatic-amino-acid transaminase
MMNALPDLSPHPFAALTAQAPDPLLSLIQAFAEDPRTDKLDLGVGVYRDDAGRTPVMSAVKAAESRLVAAQSTKAYLGPDGDPHFLDLLRPIIFGDGDAAADLIGAQTPGGTGALRLAADLLARGRPGGRIWVGTPSWPIHGGIFAAAGLAVEPYRHHDPATGRVDAASLLAVLHTASVGDAVLLHGCCHNPTGADLGPALWKEAADVIARRGLVPLIDLAYQGLGDGLEADAAGLRLMFERSDNAILAYSCDKNFALYRERTGAIYLRARGSETTVRSNLLALARCAWSMPPDHGAAVVAAILDDAELSGVWRAELDGMRRRLSDLRTQLADADPRLEPLRHQRGLFALLPLSPSQVDALRRDHAIYMAGSGRINLAGLTAETAPAFVSALRASLDGTPS